MNNYENPKTVIAVALPLMIFAFASYGNPEKTISKLAGENDDLSTLVTALKAADLAEVLNSEGPYTVFAPVNEAWAS